MKLLTYILIFASLAGCGLLPKSEITAAPIDPRVRAEQEAELMKSEKLLADTDYEAAEAGFQQVQKSFPTSVFFQRSQFGLARGRAALIGAPRRPRPARDAGRKLPNVTGIL